MASTTKELARELYLKGFSVAKIAEILDKNIKTIKNYKSQDGNWDEMRAVELIQNAPSDGNAIYGSFIEQMYSAVQEISNDQKLNAKEKANALSQVGDSFSKMRRVAGLEDPKAYKLGIAKAVIKLIVSEFQAHQNKECLSKLVELLESQNFIKAIEALE